MSDPHVVSLTYEARPGKTVDYDSAAPYTDDTCEFSLKVLIRLASLSSATGRPEEARKAPKGGKYTGPTPVRDEWMRRVVKVLIRRAGEVAAQPGVDLPKLAMSDFPPLQ